MYNYDYYNNLIIPREDNLEGFNIEEIKQYMYDFSNENNWLEKRTSNVFNSKKWLYEYYSKDDVKQEFYLYIFNSQSTLKEFMSRDRLGRIKYYNSIFTNALHNMISHIDKKRTIPLKDMEIESNYEENYFDFIIGDTLKCDVYKCVKEGLTREEIMELLNISKRKYDEIKKELREEFK